MVYCVSRKVLDIYQKVYILKYIVMSGVEGWVEVEEDSGGINGDGKIK